MKEIVNVVGALIIKDDKIFITKRADGDIEAISKYEFPGGTVEPLETNEQALKRELMEEFSVDLSVGKVLYRVVEEYSERIIDISFYEANTDDEFVLHDDHVDFKWVSFEELNNYQYPPVDKKFVDFLVANYKK